MVYYNLDAIFASLTIVSISCYNIILTKVNAETLLKLSLTGQETWMFDHSIFDHLYFSQSLTVSLQYKIKGVLIQKHKCKYTNAALCSYSREGCRYIYRCGRGVAVKEVLWSVRVMNVTTVLWILPDRQRCMYCSTQVSIRHMHKRSNPYKA